MSATAEGTGTGVSWLWRRQLEAYPDTRPRLLYLTITVLATITLYYELYVVGSVSTLVLANLHMSFTFFVVVLAVGNLVGAFGSLFAGLTDRLGRANLVVGGLLLTGVLTAFVLPAATSRWAFGFESFAVGLVEGICLVATPALIRDFSPQVGRATAMGFWTAGPVAVVATAQKVPPTVLATASNLGPQLAAAQKFAPELAVIQAHPALFAKLAADPYSKALQAQAVAAAGGGATGIAVLTTISANQTAINSVIAVGPQLQTVAPYAADLKTIAPYSADLTVIAPYSGQLTALSKVPPAAIAYLTAHGAAVQKAAAQTASQWKTWYWVCLGGIIFFLLSIPLLRGHWKPSDARRDEQEHEAMVKAELAKLSA